MKFKMLAAVGATALALSGCATYDDMDDEVAGTVSSPTNERASGNKEAVNATAQAEATGQISTIEGVEMYPSKNIIENATNSPIHTTLVAAIKAAGLVDTLSGPGPFTVFAPTDNAFSVLPEADLKALMMPENKAQLTSLLTYHVVPGTYTAKDLMALIKQGNGSATLTTVEGKPLTLTVENDFVKLNGTSYVTKADVMQSNGVIHSVNGVLLPPM